MEMFNQEVQAPFFPEVPPCVNTVSDCLVLLHVWIQNLPYHDKKTDHCSYWRQRSAQTNALMYSALSNLAKSQKVEDEHSIKGVPS